HTPLFLLQEHLDHRDPHSFPTRRSSDLHDKQQRDALAARGYWQAFQAVLSSIEKILDGRNPGEVADEDHGTWYRELFAPSVSARSEEHTSELQSRENLVCRLLLEKKKKH